ncbi:MAG TPA: hypothetical protein VHF47_14675 [Acidimicrobiales bacterium]|nr:hypothetical protein [Acidimicrobiales bacterium]
MDGPTLVDALEALGGLLEERDERHAFLAIGGGTLLLLGLVDRPTADLDVAGEVVEGGYAKLDALPPTVAEAVRDVGLAFGLRPDWVNTGPRTLLDFGLPPGMEGRVHRRRYGGLELHLPDRVDLICFKLYAAVDQTERAQPHYQDLRAMNPTPDELLAGARWARTHDPSEGFLAELRRMLSLFGVDDAP